MLHENALASENPFKHSGAGSRDRLSRLSPPAWRELWRLNRGSWSGVHCQASLSRMTTASMLLWCPQTSSSCWTLWRQHKMKWQRGGHAGQARASRWVSPCVHGPAYAALSEYFSVCYRSTRKKSLTHPAYFTTTNCTGQISCNLRMITISLRFLKSNCCLLKLSRHPGP